MYYNVDTIGLYSITTILLSDSNFFLVNIVGQIKHFGLTNDSIELLLSQCICNSCWLNNLGEVDKNMHFLALLFLFKINKSLITVGIYQ